MPGAPGSRGIPGIVTGVVTGIVTGVVTGLVAGVVTNVVIGIVTGAVAGSVTGAVTGAVTGVVTGAVTAVMIVTGGARAGGRRRLRPKGGARVVEAEPRDGPRHTAVSGARPPALCRGLRRRQRRGEAPSLCFHRGVWV